MDGVVDESMQAALLELDLARQAKEELRDEDSLWQMLPRKIEKGISGVSQLLATTKLQKQLREHEKCTFQITQL